MTEKQGTEMFELYNNTLKTWSGVLGLRNGKAQTFPLPFVSVTGISKSAFRNMTSSVEICNAWLRGLDGLVGESFEVSRKIVRGEQVETDGLTKTLRGAYENVAASMIKTLEDTPFNEGVKEIDQAVKKTMDSLTEEQEVMKEFLQEVFSFGSKTVNLFKSSNGDRADMFTEMLKGRLLMPGNDYKRTIEAYERILRHLTEAFRPLAALNPVYKDAVDDITAWAEKNAGISRSLLEANLEQNGELRSVTMEFYKLVDDTLKQGDSLEDFYKKWVVAMEKARKIYMKDPQSYKIISEFINNNTEFIKSTMKLYQDTNDLPAQPASEYMNNSAEKSEMMEAV